MTIFMDIVKSVRTRLAGRLDVKLSACSSTVNLAYVPTPAPGEDAGKTA
jgi:hypothetical protein